MQPPPSCEQARELLDNKTTQISETTVAANTPSWLFQNGCVPGSHVIGRSREQASRAAGIQDQHATSRAPCQALRFGTEAQSKERERTITADKKIVS